MLPASDLVPTLGEMQSVDLAARFSARKCSRAQGLR